MKFRKVSQAFDILLSEETQQSRNKPRIVIGRRVYFRFMDRLYVPEPVYKLAPDFVAELNRVRDEYSAIVVDPEFNEEVVSKTLAACVDTGLQPSAILDFGCGRGAAGDAITKAFPRAKVYGFDIRPLDYVAPYHQIVSGPASSPLPFPDDSFELCLSFFVFHFNVPRLQIAELARVLRPNSLLAFNLISSSDFEVLDRIHDAGFQLRHDLEYATTINSGTGFIFENTKSMH